MALKLYAISVPFGLMLSGLPTVALAIVLNNLIASTKRHTSIIFALPVLRLVLAFVEIVLLFTLCNPVSTLWNPQPGAKCRSPLFTIRFLYFLSGTDFVGTRHRASTPWLTLCCSLRCFCGCFSSRRAACCLLEAANQAKGKSCLIPRHGCHGLVCLLCYRSDCASVSMVAKRSIGPQSVRSFALPILLR